jgi:phosphoglycolate phosphatase
MARLLVFDLDGTLVDSGRDLAAAANRLVAEYNGRSLGIEEVLDMVGEGTPLLVRRALGASGVGEVPDEAVPRFMEIYGKCLLDTTRPYEGVHDMLAGVARSGRLAVLTNKPLAMACRILEGLDLARFFTDLIGGDGPFPRKPDPQAVFHLMHVAGVDAGDTMLVGDSFVDFDTARRAGTELCLARYGFGFARFPLDRLTGDEALIDSPADLPEVVAARWPA